MDAEAALRPGRDPRRNSYALALTLGLHLLGVLWLRQQRPLPPPAVGPQVVSILLQLPAARTRHAPAPAPARAPARVARPAPAQAAASPAPSPTPPAAAALPASIPATPTPLDALAPPQPAPADAASLARDPAVAAHGSFGLSVAKRQAGRIDRALRGGKSGVPVDADTPWARFQRGLEAAHIERSPSVIEDSYTSPDGVVIYRRRMGNRTSCYRTGGVGLGVAGTRLANDAGPSDCPTGVTWKRED